MHEEGRCTTTRTRRPPSRRSGPASVAGASHAQCLAEVNSDHGEPSRQKSYGVIRRDQTR
ncbi:hypothetical protein BDZ89DRAFT_1073856 [Hymenopellis radicata]|nr:hypothetical protein BDZ89DRAFT_1073856 [Hymenopellis radicata]